MRTTASGPYYLSFHSAGGCRKRVRTLCGRAYGPSLKVICILDQLTSVAWTHLTGRLGSMVLLGAQEESGYGLLKTSKLLPYLSSKCYFGTGIHRWMPICVDPQVSTTWTYQCVWFPDFRVCQGKNYQWQHQVFLCPWGSQLDVMEKPQLTDLCSDPTSITFHKLLNLSEPQFPLCKVGIIFNSIYFVRLNEISRKLQRWYCRHLVYV